MIIGPGLLVNTVFKEHWGRARPSQVEEFGGQQTIHARGHSRRPVRKELFLRQRPRFGGVFLSGIRLRLAAPPGALACCGHRPRARHRPGAHDAGGHFFSDVIFCGIVVYLSALALHAVMFHPVTESRV